MKKPSHAERREPTEEQKIHATELKARAERLLAYLDMLEPRVAMQAARAGVESAIEAATEAVLHG